eukprot:COSAG05_NODE_1181_length_5596_cov_3.093687_4_plen_81_part_00
MAAATAVDCSAAAADLAAASAVASRDSASAWACAVPKLIRTVSRFQNAVSYIWEPTVKTRFVASRDTQHATRSESFEHQG